MYFVNSFFESRAVVRIIGAVEEVCLEEEEGEKKVAESSQRVQSGGGGGNYLCICIIVEYRGLS